MTTYNHESYIAQAIEGVVMQKTNFKYELVIGEDVSQDNTRQIVKDYQKRYPNIIRLFLPEDNLGMVPMTKATYSLCTGKYIAWLDGDDYWTDPFKLQKQVDFLENNPEYSFCFHKVIVINQLQNSSAESIDPAYKEGNDTLSIEHFIQIHNPVYTLSVLHRNVLGATLPDWLFDLPYTDWGLYFILCKYGKAKYFREVMGVYRIHKGGAYSGQTNFYNFSQIVLFFKAIKKIEPVKYYSAIDRVIEYYQNELFKIHIRKFDLIGALRNKFSRNY
ncbi:glycosyltransferase family 2 protein [Hymenobacter sp. HDW8]|uniref:glycosyltransferase family 2 protein n=1 Tax=Hymenobacter sp. HDW8 TaxID=2714932 RepID=UPI00140779CA|nr:glycosyltransferase [Hymenobacter sp. HDW8]QIL76399.1 glycosyltransferase [Hymenobacter sp. HDW8]